MLDPAQLLEQAHNLADPGADEPRPPLADRCRALSAAYYAVFHTALTAAADQVVGVAERGTELYSLAYRSVDHKQIRSLCNQVLQARPSPNYAKYVPDGGWNIELQEFADGLVELQQLRLRADYDPTFVATASDAFGNIVLAERIIAIFSETDPEQKKAFLTLLLFPPR